MYSGCYSLIKASSKLEGACESYLGTYDSMFRGCSSLTEAPEFEYNSISGTTYFVDCSYMFYECTSLTKIPDSIGRSDLRAVECSYMFYGCTSLITAPELPTINTVRYAHMFEGCTSLMTVPSILPCKEMGYMDSYSYMFAGCTNITESPLICVMSFTYDAHSYCMTYMFYNCSKLNTIKVNFLSSPYTGYLDNWVSGVAVTGTFKKPKESTFTRTGTNGIPYQWTTEIQDIDYESLYLTFIIKSAGTITYTIATTTAPNIYYYYRKNGRGNWSSKQAPGTELSVSQNDVIELYGLLYNGDTATGTATSSSQYGYFSGTATFDVVGNVFSIIRGQNYYNNYTLSNTYNFYKLFNASNVVSAENLILPTVSLTNYCYGNMFASCTSLTIAPKLPATTLANYCYQYMFSGCTSLTQGPVISFTGILPTGSCRYMFQNCSSLSYVECLSNGITSTTSSSPTYRWMRSASGSGTFVKKSGTTWSTGEHGIPSGWTVIQK